MTTKENIEQLKSLIEHFNNGSNDFNATDIEAIKFLLKENQELKEKVNKLEILIESLKLGVTLNQEQEDLLDKVLFGGDSDE